jgi:hypothetical protein
MSCTRSVRFELRRNTYIGWLNSTTILLAGEPGVETDTGQMKIGDGVNLWSRLIYVGSNVPVPRTNNDIGHTGPTGQGVPIGGPAGSILTKLSSKDYDTGWTGINHLEEMVVNMGLNAFIYDTSISSQYNQITNEINYSITFFGNSSYYDLAFSYPSPITANAYTANSIQTQFYNNRLSSSEPHYTISRAFTITNPVVGNYNVNLTITTANAGGVGYGSLITRTIPITITPSDSMGNPSIVSYPTISITQGTPIIVSGITYYGPNSFISIPSRALRVNNIYNVVGPSTGGFNYVTFGGSVSGSYLNSTLVYNPPTYSAYPSPSGQNVNYYNNSSMTLYITGTSGVSATLNNAISKTQSYPRFFPSTQTGQASSVQYIGYLSATPNETTIPPNQGFTTLSGITLQTRYSISNLENTTPNTPALSNIISFNSTSLTKWDPAYNPLDGCFYASSDITTNLNSNYVLPSAATFTPGTKYLLLKLDTRAIQKSFYVSLGASATNVSNLWVYWASDSGPLSSFGWYDASIEWQEPNGCQDGTTYDRKNWNIRLNRTAESAYTNPIFIYVNIAFTGKIKLSEIVIR